MSHVQIYYLILNFIEVLHFLTFLEPSILLSELTFTLDSVRIISFRTLLPPLVFYSKHIRTTTIWLDVRPYLIISNHIIIE